MTSASSHASGREALLQAWGKVFGSAPSLGALQLAAAVAIHESGYGKACYTNKVSGETFCGTHNWGAVQGSKVDPSRGMRGGFFMSDFDSTTGKTFQANYQLYDDDVSGAAHMLSLLDFFAGDELQAGDVDGFSRAMYIGAPRGGTIENPKGYYGGFHTIAGKTGAARLAAANANVEDHAKSMAAKAKDVADKLGEPLEAVRGGSFGAVPFSECSSELPPDTERTGSLSTCAVNVDECDPLPPDYY